MNEINKEIDIINDMAEKMWNQINEYDPCMAMTVAGSVCALVLTNIGMNITDKKEKEIFIKSTIKLIENMYRHKNNICRKNH